MAQSVAFESFFPAKVTRANACVTPAPQICGRGVTQSQSDTCPTSAELLEQMGILLEKIGAESKPETLLAYDCSPRLRAVFKGTRCARDGVRYHSGSIKRKAGYEKALP